MSDYKTVEIKEEPTVEAPKEDAMEQAAQDDPKLTFRTSTLSKASGKFDIGNKGYLTEAERLARNLDSSNRGLLTNEKVVMIVEETIKLKEAHSSLEESMGNMKKLMFSLMFLIVVLSLCNLGTSFVAVHLAREVTIGEGGTLRSAKDGLAVHTVGNGQVFELEERVEPITGWKYACVDMNTATAMYQSARDGVSTTVVMRNSSVDTFSAERGLALEYQGATVNDTHACVNQKDGMVFCFDFSSDLCVPDAHNHRFLLNDMSHSDRLQSRRKLFELTLKGASPEEMQRHLTHGCSSCNGCSGCRRLYSFAPPPSGCCPAGVPCGSSM